jgi:glycosidase
MEGEKPDEDIRLPMRWYKDSEDTKQTTWRADRYHSNDTDNGIDVESQLQDENSLLHHYKSLIYARRASEALIMGEIKSTSITEDGIVSFERIAENEEKLVIHNLSNVTKEINLSDDLTEYTNYFFYLGELDDIRLKDNVIKIPGYTTVILKK